MPKSLLAVLLFAITLFSSAALAADVTGSWAGEAVVKDEAHPIFLTLKQDGATLTGTGGPSAEEQKVPLAGKVDGDKLIFDVTAGELKLHFELTAVEGNFKGTVEVRKDGEPATGTVSIKKVG